MSHAMLISGSQVYPPAGANQTAVAKSSATTAEHSPALEQDHLALKQGFLPALKGAGVGVLTMGLASWPLIPIAERLLPGTEALAVPFIGLPVSLSTGAIVANITTDKSTAAWIGAGMGAMGAAAFAAMTGSLEIPKALAIGVVSGAIGGLSGALAAERK